MITQIVSERTFNDKIVAILIARIEAEIERADKSENYCARMHKVCPSCTCVETITLCASCGHRIEVTK
jgi:hypothetical protein